MSTASFDVSKGEADLIWEIVMRASDLCKLHGFPLSSSDRLSLVMDITACHASGCPLDLAGLQAADNFSFAHDVFGIRDHMDRISGKLVNCFVPRFALKVAASAARPS